MINFKVQAWNVYKTREGGSSSTVFTNVVDVYLHLEKGKEVVTELKIYLSYIQIFFEDEVYQETYLSVSV